MIIKTGTLEPIVPTGTDWNIEFDCRTKTLKSVSLPLIVSGENNSTVLLIKTPLYYNSVDLTTVNCIVKYKTSWIKEDGSVNEGQVDLTNTATKFDDYIIYTWALDQRQTRLPGKCDFSLKFFMNLNEDPYQNQTRYYLQKISNENGESLQIGKDEMITDIEQKYWSIASLPSSINIGDGGSIAEGVEPDDSMANSGYDDGYNQGYADGQQAEYDKFWDGLQDYGNRTDYNRGFTSWSGAEYIRPKYKIHFSANAPYLFSGCSKLKRVYADDLDFSGIPESFSNSAAAPIYAVFNRCHELEYVEDVNFQPKYSYEWIFYQNYALETIEMIRSHKNSSFYNAFNDCKSLKNVTFEGTIGKQISFAQSQKLTAESVQNIIDHLADLTGNDTKTLTLNSAVGAKLTDEQKATITAKNWTLAY